MKKILISALLVCFLTASANSIQQDTTKVRLGFKNYVGMGVRFVTGLKNLNKDLSSIDYPEVSLNPVLYNFGVALSRGKGSFGVAYNFLIYPESNKGDLTSTGFGFGSEFRYTCNVIQKDKFLLYPIFGLGVQFNRFHNKFSEELSFGNAISSPQVDPSGRTEPLQIRGEEYFGSLGLGYERLFNRDNKRKTAYSLGIQAAYCVGLYNAWMVDYQKVDTNANTGGFEIRFLFSGIRFSQKR